MTGAMLVAGTAAALLSTSAVLVEGVSISHLGFGGLFGWLDLKYLGRVTWMAVGPGVVGHTGLNLLLRWGLACVCQHAAASILIGSI